jgi:hypothetical protein
VNALANPEVGKYLNEYFCSSFQKVGTFKIVGKQKQGGNVAAYFCAPDGRVLHCVAGPVNAATLLHEAKWLVDNTKKAMEQAKGDGAKFKAYFRKLHADRLRNDFGLAVEAVTYDPPEAQDDSGALSYRDPSGRPLAPKLPPPPLDGPDVTIRAAVQLQEARGGGLNAPGVVLDKRGRGWVLGNQGRVHMLLAGHAMVKIEKVYASIFEGILGERVSTKPVQVDRPFSWVREKSQLKSGG